MFILCSTLAILTSTVFAIDVQAPVEPTSGALTTIHWTPDPAVPVFSMELVHPEFNDALAIANSVNGSLGYLKVDLPAVPADDGYTLQFVNISDIDDVYATSPVFAIAAPPTTSEAPTSALSSTSVSAPATGTLSGTKASASVFMSGSAAAASASSSASASASAGAHNAAAAQLIRGTFWTGAVPVLLSLIPAVWIL